MRSDKMKTGSDRSLARMLMQAGGLTGEQIDKPLIGVIGSYTNIFAGHAHLDRISKLVQDGVLIGGGTPAISNVIAICDGMCENTPGMRYPLPSRDVIADSIEAYVEGHSLDGLVCIANCDKIVPGMLMAIMRLNIPAIFLSGGPSLPPEDGYDSGERLAKIMAAAKESKESISFDMVDNVLGPCPGCNSGMGTAVSMQMMSEVLGVGPMGNATIPGAYNQRSALALWVGQRIVEMVREDLKPSDIITKESFKNCIRIDMMMGCSTNTTLHLPAIAAEAGYKIVPDDFDKASHTTPQIAKIYPCMSSNSVNDFRRAGSLAAVINEGIKAGLIDGSTGTLYGKSLAEVVQDAKVLNREIIRPIDDPYSAEGGLAILKGNLAPEGCVIKTSGVLPEMLEHRGRARVFDSEAACYDAITAGKIQPGDCIVIRYEGPAGGPGMREMLTVTSVMRAYGLSSTVSLITDGRFSGASVGGVIGHVSPEAIKGGLIALVEDGDIIEYSIPKRKITLLVGDEELEERRKCWIRPEIKIKKGFLSHYAAQASSAASGARMVAFPKEEADLIPINM